MNEVPLSENPLDSTRESAARSNDGSDYQCPEYSIAIAEIDQLQEIVKRAFRSIAKSKGELSPFELRTLSETKQILDDISAKGDEMVSQLRSLRLRVDFVLAAADDAAGKLEFPAGDITRKECLSQLNDAIGSINHAQQQLRRAQLNNSGPF